MGGSSDPWSVLRCQYKPKSKSDCSVFYRAATEWKYSHHFLKLTCPKWLLPVTVAANVLINWNSRCSWCEKKSRIFGRLLWNVIRSRKKHSTVVLCGKVTSSSMQSFYKALVMSWNVFWDSVVDITIKVDVFFIIQERLWYAMHACFPSKQNKYSHVY